MHSNMIIMKLILKEQFKYIFVDNLGLILSKITDNFILHTFLHCYNHLFFVITVCLTPSSRFVFGCLFVHSFFRSFVHSFIRSFVRLLVYLFMH